MADARQLRAHVADFDTLDARDSVEEILPKFGEIITVRGGETYTSDDDTR